MMSENWNWIKENQSRYSAGPDTFVLRRAGGWGQRFNAYCKREWAAHVDGKYLVNAAGNIRQFATSKAAKIAAENYILERAITHRSSPAL